MWPNFDPGRIVAGESRWNGELTTAGIFSPLEISIANSIASCRQQWKTRLVARNCCWTAFLGNSKKKIVLAELTVRIFEMDEFEISYGFVIYIF